MDLEHEKRLTEVESRSSSNTKRIDAMEKRQNDLDDLVTTVKVLANREERVEEDVKEIKGDVKEIKAIPKKRWEGLVDKVIYTGIGAIITYICVKLGF